MSNVKIFTTDWLGTHPVYFNRKTKKVSRNIHNVIEYGSVKFHPEGLKNYLDFGYSVFGQTPIQDVEFLLPCQQLVLSNNKFVIRDLPDPFNTIKALREEEIFLSLQRDVLDWGKHQTTILLPMSGGYDSRLLAFFARALPQLHTFTYGIAESQLLSHEVVHAVEISKRLNLDWEFIKLGNYLRLIPGWFQLFGPAIHAHGMYQMEFYSKIFQRHERGALLSGIFGDVWAGNGQYQKLILSEDLIKISYSHGLHADSSALLFTAAPELREQFWQERKEALQEEKYQIVQLIRLKMILISYLLRVPEHFGFKTYAPYLKPQIALSMLALPAPRRHNRVWQQDFLRRNNLLVEGLHLSKSYQNWLNHLALRIHPLPPLSHSLLSAYFKKEYIDWINFHVQSTLMSRVQQTLLHSSALASGMQLLHIPDIQMKAYSAYLTLKPLELVLKKNEGLS